MKSNNNKYLKIILPVFFCVLILFSMNLEVFAAPGISITQNGVDIGSAQSPKDMGTSLQILFLLTILSIAPAILIMMTSFTRIIIILSFLRNALGTQQMPPNQVLIGLALFLSLFIMSPVIDDINNNAFQPYVNGKIEQKIALDNASKSIKGFMLKQMHHSEKDLALFVSLTDIKTPVVPEDLPLKVVIPAFIISELKIAFQIGFLIFIPFLIIDMVVSSTLMSMGMMMLPPVMISLPFKILLFIMAGGWNLLTKSILSTFVQ